MRLVTDGDHGAALSFQRLGLGMDLRRFLGTLLKIAVRTEPEASSFKPSGYALAGNNLHVLRVPRQQIIPMGLVLIDPIRRNGTRIQTSLSDSTAATLLGR